MARTGTVLYRIKVKSLPLYDAGIFIFAPIVEKGEVYESNLFTAQNELFMQDIFVDEVKHFYTDLINWA